MGGMRQHRNLHGSVEIALTADVAVAQRLVVGRLVEKSAIKAVLEDRADRGDGTGLDEDAASAGCIDARVVVAPGQRQDAEAGAKTLLGMGPGSDDGLEKGCGRRTDLLAGCDQPTRRPLAIAAMGARHVIGNRGMAAPVGRTGVARDPLALVENLDRLVSDAHIDEFTDKSIGGGIPMAVDLDVIIGGDAATLPARKDVWLVRQFSQLKLVDLGEEFGAAGAKTAHLAGVELDDQHANGGIEFRQGKEAMIAQTRQDPALRDLDGDLNLRLVLWASRPRREDRGAVMARHLGVGPVETGIVAIGVGDGGLEIIADHELRHAAQKPEQIGMQGDPIG